MKAYFVIPGDIGQPTGGYGYDRKVLEHAGAAGLELVHVAIPGGFPFPDDAVLRETARRLEALPADAVLLIDGLAYGAMPADMLQALPHRLVELCHHPLALEPGIDATERARLHAGERAAMAMARRVIVTGPQTAGIVARDFGVSPERIAIALPGTDPAKRAGGSGGMPHRLLAVGSIIPRKGYDVLVRALADIADLDWTLDIVGSQLHAPDTVVEVQNLIQALRLADRIALRGALDSGALEQAYAKADLFVMATHYEGYGMVIAEAMARGLPIVTTDGGAVVDTFDARAGFLVPDGMIQELAKAIREMLATPGNLKHFSQGSWTAGQMLPRWSDTATAIAATLREVAR